MRMTLATADRQAHPDGERRVDAVHDRLDPILLLVDPPLPIGQRVAMKPGRQLHLVGRPWQQVTGYLLFGELIKRQVAVDGINQPVAPAERVRPGQILFIPVTVGIPGQVQPFQRPAFSEVR